MSSPPLRAIGELVEPVSSWTPERDDPDGVFTYIDLSAIDQDAKVVSGAREVACTEAPSRARQLVRAGDVLVSTVRPNLNGIARVPTELDRATASTGFCVLRPTPDELAGQYLYHWVKSPRFVSDMVRQATGASYPAVSDRIVCESRLPLPPIPEQRRIAEILDKADALRAKRRAALAQLETLTQSIFLDMFGDPATNAKGWEVRCVGEVAEVQGGLQVTSARRALPREVPYLRVANVYRGALDLREIKTIRATDAEVARTSLVKDDFLIVEGHGNPQEIGRGALWDGSIPLCVHQNHIIRVRFDSEKTNPQYACTYLNSPAGRAHLLRSGKTTSGLNTISVSEVRSTPITVPSIELQRDFARRVAGIRRINTAQAGSLGTLESLFASLQHRAFRGEL